MTAVTTEETPLIDRDTLAAALRTVATCWEGPRLPGTSPRAVAAQVIAEAITDQPKRGSEWLGDGQPGLTVDQAHRAVREFVVRSVPPAQALRAAQDVLNALDGILVAPSAGHELTPDDGTTVHCQGCGKPYVPRNRNHRYHAPACRQRAYVRRQKAD